MTTSTTCSRTSSTPAPPSRADFRMVVVAMQDGRVLNGIVKSRNERTLTLQTQNELLVLDRGEIEGLKPTSASLMPEGQLDRSPRPRSATCSPT